MGGVKIGGEVRPVPHPRIFFHQTVLFMILPPNADLCDGVAAIKGPLGNKHIAFGASGVGPFTLPQDCKCVPHMA